MAEAMLGFGDKAVELYKMINPIEHTRTRDAVQKYKVEPYVIPADIYGAGNLAGRGGWTWYTGSASWYYKAGIEYILGLKIENNVMTVKPCIPKEWDEFRIDYLYGKSVYHIIVRNNGEEIDDKNGENKILINGKEADNKIILDGNGGIYNIEVFLFS